MTRYHTSYEVNTGERTSIPYTKDEDDARDEEEAQHLAERPMVDWKRAIAEASASMPDFMEQHIRDDHNGVVSSLELQKLYDDKTALRGGKPTDVFTERGLSAATAAKEHLAEGGEVVEPEEGKPTGPTFPTPHGVSL